MAHAYGPVVHSYDVQQLSFEGLTIVNSIIMHDQTGGSKMLPVRRGQDQVVSQKGTEFHLTTYEILQQR